MNSFVVTARIFLLFDLLSAVQIYVSQAQANSEKINSECSYQESNLRPSDY